MDTLSAFARAELARASGNRERVFDWVKAAQMIKESGAKHAVAGLSTDMEWTSGVILYDGQIVDDYTYLASVWATPVIELDYGDEQECWVYMDESEYDARTKWPEEALKILYGEGDGVQEDPGEE